MRFALMLATIPAVTFGGGYALTPVSSPIVASTVAVEGIRAQRMDAETFRLRFSPVSEMPPTEMRAREHRWQDRVGKGTSSISRGDDPILMPASTAIEVRRVATTAVDNAGTVKLTPAPPPSRRLRSRAVRLDICARHGMRKVSYGKRWRCRR